MVEKLFLVKRVTHSAHDAPKSVTATEKEQGIHKLVEESLFLIGRDKNADASLGDCKEFSRVHSAVKVLRDEKGALVPFLLDLNPKNSSLVTVGRVKKKSPKIVDMPVSDALKAELRLALKTRDVESVRELVARVPNEIFLKHGVKLALNDSVNYITKQLVGEGIGEKEFYRRLEAGEFIPFITISQSFKLVAKPSWLARLKFFVKKKFGGR
ncbi:hypothetical protein H0N96_02165 [Candidatus Micrarchaeota archaeon]|nr:hypothetical protein [Candidatus Micrarchaeota archaeon]